MPVHSNSNVLAPTGSHQDDPDGEGRYADAGSPSSRFESLQVRCLGKLSGSAEQLAMERHIREKVRSQAVAYFARGWGILPQLLRFVLRLEAPAMGK